MTGSEANDATANGTAKLPSRGRRLRENNRVGRFFNSLADDLVDYVAAAPSEAQ